MRAHQTSLPALSTYGVGIVEDPNENILHKNRDSALKVVRRFAFVLKDIINLSFWSPTKREPANVVFYFVSDRGGLSSLLYYLYVVFYFVSGGLSNLRRILFRLRDGLSVDD
jgi:hypothetical protein